MTSHQPLPRSERLHVLPNVVIVIPTYNRASTIRAAIESALEQDYDALSVLVVDDGSTDDTASVLARYRDHPRVATIVRESNGGVTAAKNTGLDALPSRCTYFGILDSDDVLLPGAIRSLVDAHEAHATRLSQVFGWCTDADTGEATGSMTYREGPVTYDDALCGRFDGEFWQLVRRDALGTWRFDVDAAGNEAHVWWPMMKEAQAFLIDRTVRSYDRSGMDRVNRPSFTAAGAYRKMRGYEVLLERVGNDMRHRCPARFASMALECGKWAALAGMRWRATTSVWAALVTSPSWRVAKVAVLLPMPGSLARRAYRALYRTALS